MWVDSNSSSAVMTADCVRRSLYSAATLHPHLLPSTHTNSRWTTSIGNLLLHFISRLSPVGYAAHFVADVSITPPHPNKCQLTGLSSGFSRPGQLST